MTRGCRRFGEKSRIRGPGPQAVPAQCRRAGAATSARALAFRTRPLTPEKPRARSNTSSRRYGNNSARGDAAVRSSQAQVAAGAGAEDAGPGRGVPPPGRGLRARRGLFYLWSGGGPPLRSVRPWVCGAVPSHFPGPCPEPGNLG